MDALPMYEGVHPAARAPTRSSPQWEIAPAIPPPFVPMMRRVALHPETTTAEMDAVLAQWPRLSLSADQLASVSRELSWIHRQHTLEQEDRADQLRTLTLGRGSEELRDIEAKLRRAIVRLAQDVQENSTLEKELLTAGSLLGAPLQPDEFEGDDEVDDDEDVLEGVVDDACRVGGVHSLLIALSDDRRRHALPVGPVKSVMTEIRAWQVAEQQRLQQRLRAASAAVAASEALAAIAEQQQVLAEQLENAQVTLGDVPIHTERRRRRPVVPAATWDAAG